MEKIVVFGVGNYYESKKETLNNEYVIIGFLDNFFNLDIFEDKKVFSISDLKNIEYDKCIIMSSSFMAIAKQLIQEGIGYEKIEFGQNILPHNFNEKIFYNENTYLGFDEKGFYYTKEFDDRNFECKRLKAYFTSESELANIQNIWVKEEYNIFENIISESGKIDIFDIGMNLGGGSLWFANHKCVEKVYGIEPSESTYKYAEYNVHINEVIQGKIELFNIGLDKFYGKERILFNPEMSCGFSTDQRHNDISIQQYVEWVNMNVENNYYVDVTIENAADFILNRINKNKIIVKMDCEGSEYHIFEEMQDRFCINKIYAFIVEWHDDGPEYILDLLKKNGFVMISMRDSWDKGMIYAFNMRYSCNFQNK